MLKKLIGYQILEMNENTITLKKNNEIITVEIVDDSGDCCGFNNISTELLYTPNNENNPVITNVELIKNNKDEYEDGDEVTITFFGEYVPIAKLNSYSSSGSGWGYGATVSLICKSLDIDEIITSW